MNTRPSSFFVFTPNFKARRNPVYGKTYAAKCDFCNFFVIVSKKSNNSLTFKYFYGKLLGVFDYPDKDSLVTVRKGIRING